MAMIPRTAEQLIHELLSGFPIVTVTGPRQSGKTTLVRAVLGERPYLSLEDPDIRALATDDPRGFLSRFPDGAILDEVQPLDVGSALPATPFTLRIADDLLKIGFSAPRENVRAAIQVTVQQFSACHRAAHVGLPKLRSSRVSVCRDWASPITMREKSGWRGLSK